MSIAITGIDFAIVQALPATGVKGTIYLVPADSNGMQGDVYNEHIWLEADNDNPAQLLGQDGTELCHPVRRGGYHRI